MRYRTAAGVPLISVTQALTVAGQIDATWFTAESAWRGQEVHRLTEVFDRGEPLVIPAGLGGYVDAYAAFLQVVRPVYRASEVAVTSDRLKVGGRIDRVCRDLLGRPGLLDFKTSPPYPWHGQQLALYNRLKPTGARWGCYLRADGTYRLKRYDDPHDDRLAMAAVAHALGTVYADGDFWIART